MSLFGSSPKRSHGAAAIITGAGSGIGAAFATELARRGGWPIATMSPVGIRTSDGVEHHLDAIVFATGYDVHLTGPPYSVTGLGGRSLADEWTGGAKACKSINASGYPNLFFMTGPNSGPGHNSLLVFVEGQIDYGVFGITTILRSDRRYLDVRAEVQRRTTSSCRGG